MRIRTASPGLIGCLVVALLSVSVAISAPLSNNQRRTSLTDRMLFARMDRTARRVQTVSAQLAYTTVTVLVDARTTDNGALYYRKGRRPEVRIEFTGPDAKVIVFRKGSAEIYYPKINQIQEYNLARHQNLLQQFLLLGFGTETSQLESSYSLHFLGEKKLGNETTYLLELSPLSKDVAAQLKKVDLWISSETWMPIQQEFFEPSGDYLIARYSNMEINHPIPPSSFRIKAPGAERVRMN